MTGNYFVILIPGTQRTPWFTSIFGFHYATTLYQAEQMMYEIVRFSYQHMP